VLGGLQIASVATASLTSLEILVSEGLVEQSADARDGRGVALALAAAGRRTLAADDARQQATIAELTADWSEDEGRLFAALSARINVRGKEYVEHRRRSTAGGGVR
jgi:DNA-binding MarR family transcriptional regulator